MKGWQQSSLLDSETVRQVTVQRGERIAQRLQRQNAALTNHSAHTGPEEPNEGLQSPEGQSVARKAAEE